jgi:hypothetical protein
VKTARRIPPITKLSPIFITGVELKMGNTDSVFKSLVLGEEVEDSQFEVDSKKNTAIVGALLWGEEADEAILPVEEAHSLPPLPREYEYLEKLRLPQTWEEYEVTKFVFHVEEEGAQIAIHFPLLILTCMFFSLFFFSSLLVVP